MRAWNLSKNSLNNVKGKIHLRTGHEAQNGSNAFSLTSVLYGGWVVNTTPQSLYQREGDLAPIVQDTGWETGWSRWVLKISPQPGLNAWTIYPVASIYTDYTIHLIMCWKETNQLMAMLLLQFFTVEEIQYKVNT